MSGFSRRVCSLVTSVAVSCGATVFVASSAQGTTTSASTGSTDLDSALLTEQDLAADSDYMAFPDTPMPTGEPTGGICNGPTSTALAEDAGGQGAGVSFFANRQTSDGPVLSEILFVFPSTGTAKKFMATGAKQVDKCTKSWSVTRTPGDTPYVWTIKPRKISPLGDQRFASRQITSSAPDDISRDPDLPGVSEDAAVRVGNKVLLLSRAGISEAVDLNKTGFDDDLKLAVRKLKGAHAVSVTTT